MIRIVILAVVGLLAGLGGGTAVTLRGAKHRFEADSAARRAQASLTSKAESTPAEPDPAHPDGVMAGDPSSPAASRDSAPADPHAAKGPRTAERAASPSTPARTAPTVVARDSQATTRDSSAPVASTAAPTASPAAPTGGKVGASAERRDSTPAAPTIQPTRLAKIFAAMPPKEASRVLVQLDDRDVTTILGSLNDRQAAAILAAFPPERAAAISRAAVRGARSGGR